MNREELIRRITEDRKAEADRKSAMEESHSKDDSSDRTLGHVADMLDGLAEVLTQNTQTVKVQNHPKEHKVKGSVSMEEADEILDRLEDVQEAIEDSVARLEVSVVGAINSEKAVTVKNFELPVIPEPLKHVTASVDQLPKYVGEGLEGIRKAVKELKLSVSVPPAEVTVQPPDLSALDTRFAGLSDILSRILAKEEPKEEPIDLSGLESSLASLASLMEAVRDNTGIKTSQTFKSSWEKSFDMRSNDLATSWHYLTHVASGKKVNDYVQVTDADGSVYRREFAFDANGDRVSASAWTLQ